MTGKGTRFFGMIFMVIINAVSVLIFMCELSDIVQKASFGNDEWRAAVYYPMPMAYAEATGFQLSNFFRIKTKIEEAATSKFNLRIPFVLIKKMCDKAAGLDMTVSLCAGENDINDFSDIVLTYRDDYLGFVMDHNEISQK